MLNAGEISSYHEQGFLHIPNVFTANEMDRLESDLDSLIQTWAITDPGWSGPWRQAYMDPELEAKVQLQHLHDLHFYSEAWMRAVTKPNLAEAMAELLDGPVELHHTTLHAKPPRTGHPFPMHQDMPFYEHSDGRYVDVLVHIDDTCHANGEIRFLAGSHKLGYLPHVTETAEGPCTPHLPPSEYRLEDTTPVPAKRGDVVCFNVNTIHGSYMNTTDAIRRLIRVGYRHTENVQVGGQSMGRPGIMVHGLRPNPRHAPPLTTEPALA